MNQTNQEPTRISITGAEPTITETKGAVEFTVVRTLVLTEGDMTLAGLEARATEVGSVLEEILHHNPTIKHWGLGLNEW